jgi:transposase-like protein
MNIPDTLFKNPRYPTEIIQYAVCLYFVFPLRFRDVELLFHERGIIVRYETIRAGRYEFGLHCAQQIRRKRRPATDKWHLDEVFVTINRRARERRMQRFQSPQQAQLFLSIFDVIYPYFQPMSIVISLICVILSGRSLLHNFRICGVTLPVSFRHFIT